MHYLEDDLHGLAMWEFYDLIIFIQTGWCTRNCLKLCPYAFRLCVWRLFEQVLHKLSNLLSWNPDFETWIKRKANCERSLELLCSVFFYKSYNPHEYPQLALSSQVLFGC